MPRRKDFEIGASLPANFQIGDFDVSPDGGEIVFDRLQETSSVVLIERAEESDTN
jgi:hypothetical protein